MILLHAPPVIINKFIRLPSSKSISNRLLVLNALSEKPAKIVNLSEALDTFHLQKCLENPLSDNYCGDGATTLRFLIAVRALQDNPGLITGSDSLNSRPLKPFLDALTTLGAEFIYTGAKFHPPLKIIKGITNGGEVTINAGISSQYISALMMIAPLLKNGLIIHLEGEIVSVPYIHTTAALMIAAGTDVQISGNTIRIPQGAYFPPGTIVPSDWTAASYWFGFAACLPGSTFTLNNLSVDDLQGDVQVISWMKAFGVRATSNGNDLQLSSEKIDSAIPLQLNFSDNPDLAQTFAVTAAVTGRSLKLTGLKSLRVKETDRIAALITELKKTGVAISGGDDWIQIEGKAEPSKIQESTFAVYNDHRMAMSLSILSCCGAGVSICDEKVVDKSYPQYFNELERAGFSIITG